MARKAPANGAFPMGGTGNWVQAMRIAINHRAARERRLAARRLSAPRSISAPAGPARRGQEGNNGTLHADASGSARKGLKDGRGHNP